MIETMKLNNRDPFGRKLNKVKIKNNYCILEDKNDREKEERRQNKRKNKRQNKQRIVKDGIETFRCTILTQFLLTEELYEKDEDRGNKKEIHNQCDADKIFALIEKNYEFEVLGKPAKIGLQCISMTISRNR